MLNDADWINNAGIISYNTPIALLPAGQSTSIDITLQCLALQLAQYITMPKLKVPTMTTTLTMNILVTLIPILTMILSMMALTLMTKSMKNRPVDEDDQDLAFILGYPTGTFDLALRKVISPNQQLPVSEGSDITFTITVFNQGAVDAYNIEVVDYIPTELTLNDNQRLG